MDMRTEGVDTRSKVKAPGGRKDKSGTEAVPEVKPVKEALQDLVKAKKKVDAAREKLNEAVRSVAKAAGMNAAVVRGMVNSAQKDSKGFNADKRKAEQAAMLFDEIAWQGEVSEAVDGDQKH